MVNEAQAIAAVLTVARGMYMPENSAAMLAKMMRDMAHSPEEILTFADRLRDSGLGKWPTWNDIRALWCRDIGTPRDGRTATANLPREGDGEQHQEPFPGCSRCVNGWKHGVITRHGKTYTGLRKCECLKLATLADPNVPKNLEASAGKREIAPPEVRMLAKVKGMP